MYFIFTISYNHNTTIILLKNKNEKKSFSKKKKPKKCKKTLINFSMRVFLQFLERKIMNVYKFKFMDDILN